MIRKKSLLILTILSFFFLFACSSEDSESSEDSQSTNDIAETRDMEIGYQEESEKAALENSTDEAAETEEAPNDNGLTEEDRKIIYNAYLQIETKGFDETINFIEKETRKNNGYIVESRVHNNEENENRNGSLTLRIPSESFADFLVLLDEGDMKIVEESVTGDDVTEQYVDLEARLKSKNVVEKRLLSFMENAEKTEDLLKISNDLAKVQEEIEQITGKMKYLENHAALATVTIELWETDVKIPSIENDDLNTWEKTKEQFMKSINILLQTASALFIFFAGNLPIFILITAVLLVVYIIYKRKKKSAPKE
ncbi:DUF4349 domain-containing protein [Saliterribacillus persicus]|uniref:Uncharacterized protein DUF4349 n=1 Tax=Saliterribacillus persicus TaxID=930114 RepID=A0A368Y123_9BACI|nr:DUF4349 domain-containing protein [Saliterribacillus persicus]RCW73086.1 uncharacterized protein DUF4349 [Saliterribacillus persicus]